MDPLYLSNADQGNEEVVRVPRPADAIGAALRGAFGTAALPAEWMKLLSRLDRR